MENLLSGFLGALIALMISVILGRLSNSIRLNRIRKSIIIYLERLAKPKVERYLNDCKKGIKSLNQKDLDEEERKNGFDDMPMLTSEVLKSYPQQDLLSVSSNAENYSNILDFYYSVDFLKKMMPLSICDEYFSLTRKHLEEKNIPGPLQLDHLKTCEYLKVQREHFIRNIEMKIGTTECVKENLESILQNLSGRTLKWVWKYFWKQ